MLLPSKDKTSAPNTWVSREAVTQSLGKARNSEVNSNSLKYLYIWVATMTDYVQHICHSLVRSFFKVPDPSPRGNTTKSGLRSIETKDSDHEEQVHLDKTNRRMLTPNLKQKNTWLRIPTFTYNLTRPSKHTLASCTQLQSNIINLSTQILGWHPLKPWNLSSLMLVTNQSISHSKPHVYSHKT